MSHEQPSTPEIPLSEGQKHTLRDLALAYKFWVKVHEEGEGHLDMIKIIFDKQVRVQDKPKNDYEWGMLMGIYIAIANVDRVQEEKAYADLISGL